MRVGRFILYEPFARGGGGASLHLACMTGEGDLKRVVAMKQLSRASMDASADRDAAMAELLDEARIAARVHHANVVDVLELCVTEDGVFLAMEYVHGATLAELIEVARERGVRIPVELACTLVGDVLLGLHAAHVTTGPTGERAGIVHRDVAPENILVGADGVARIGDFGIATSRGRQQTTSVGQVKGRLGYVAPERLVEQAVTPLCDVYSAGVVLYELCTGRSPFAAAGDDRDEKIGQVLAGISEPPSRFAPVPESLDDIVRRATALRPEERFADALAFAAALEEAFERWPPRRVGAWVEELAAVPMAARAQRIEELLSEEKTAMRPLPAPAPGEPRAPSRAPAIGRRAGSTATLPPFESIALSVAAALGVAVVAAAALHEPDAEVPAAETATADDVQASAPAASGQPTDAPSAAPSEPVATSPTDATGAATPPRSPRAAQRDRSPCLPPYRIDERGIRRWKKGCTK